MPGSRAASGRAHRSRALCPEVRRLSIGSPEQQRAWMMQRLQPYRVESLQGPTDGLLTGYYEPMLEASRVADGHQQRAACTARRATLPAAGPGTRARKSTPCPRPGRRCAAARSPGWPTRWMRWCCRSRDPGVCASPSLTAAGALVRLAFAATNEQPYRSVGSWLLQQGAIRDASWPGIKAWVAQNPQRVNEMLWSNPRTVFFREEPLSDMDAAFGPRGAQGVPLTPGRSIAVDKDSIPYGTPVWLASSGPAVNLQRLVLAQDTGSAIVGAVRADYFAGWGPEAGEVAGRLKQPLRLWVLWPK